MSRYSKPYYKFYATLGKSISYLRVYLMNGLGIETGVDLDRLVDAGAWICTELGREPSSKVARAVLAKRRKQ